VNQQDGATAFTTIMIFAGIDFEIGSPVLEGKSLLMFGVIL
jgi:hypothetical protein